MAVTDIVAGVRIAAERAIDRFVIQPRREKMWSGKTKPFEHRSGEGHRFTLHPTEYVDRFIFLHGIYEKRFLRFLRHRFAPNAVALDIGANIGNHAVYLASSFAIIHAFEPNPDVATRLRANIALNGLDDRVRVHQLGLGATTETLRFQENASGNLGASGFLKAGRDAEVGARVLELPIVRADDYVVTLKLDRLDFVKVDVEGWEASLFTGLRETIARYRPVIAFEFHGQDTDPDEYDRILATLPGYIISELRYAPAEGSIARKLVWNVTRAGRPMLDRVDRPEKRTYETLLAVPDAPSFARFSAAG